MNLSPDPAAIGIGEDELYFAIELKINKYEKIECLVAAPAPTSGEKKKSNKLIEIST